MPTYEYVCTECGQHVEVFQRIGEDSLTECGVCRGRLRKVFHPAGILFKGSGFYATDSRKSSKTGSKSGEPSSKPGSKSGESSSSSEKTSEAKSDSKPPAPKEKSA
jgi:putative FmdB family regulatory protein